ncbi:MAG: DUF1569 domain-containing protein [Ferruginibacter sp.]
MEVKNLFDGATRAEVTSRIHQLTPQTQRVWGKMDVSQMLAHLQMPMGVALGDHTLKGNFFMRLILPFFKKMLWDDKPYKRSLPTDKTFVMASPKDFENEKQKLLDMVARFTPENLVTEIHPVFGKMTKEQWSMATWKHIDHHLQQFGV